MSLAFGVGTGPDLIGAMSVPQSFTPKKRRSAAAAFLARPVFLSRDFLERATASRGNRNSGFADGATRRMAMRREESEIRNEFSRIADLAGLTDQERAVLAGDSCELSHVILALETIGAALDLFREPTVAIAWLQEDNFAEPFNGRSPLRLMAADGRLGVEITLLHLKARRRAARA
jgi:hypothetical protein